MLKTDGLTGRLGYRALQIAGAVFSIECVTAKVALKNVRGRRKFLECVIHTVVTVISNFHIILNLYIYK